jgi:hypothetical protein
VLDQGQSRTSADHTSSGKATVAELVSAHCHEVVATVPGDLQ